jgi:glycosyltransferase involved in cell wall biosynthesis
MRTDPGALQGSVLVLVSHEPTLDPRVHYTSEALAKRYATMVIATVPEAEERPFENRPARAGYTSARIPYRRNLKALYSGLALVGMWLTPRLSESRSRVVMRRTARGIALCIALPLVLVAMLAVGLAVVLFSVTVGSVRRVTRGAMSHSAQWPSSPVAMLAAAVHRTGARAVRAAIRMISGPRATLSVMRFTLQTNALLWDRAIQSGSTSKVVYCHDLYTLQAGAMLKRRWGARLVYDSHEYYPYQYTSRCFRTVIGAYEAMLVREVDVYITVSPQLAEELERGYRVRPVHAIPNVEPVPDPKPSIPKSEMSDLADRRLKLLFQGAFAEGRGLEEVLREWTGVDGTRIALFLRGPQNEWRERLEYLAEELGLLGKSVYFLHPLLEKDLIGAAQEADIGLIPYKGDLPSYRFACPNKLSQYLHAGLAILANRIPFVEQTVARGQVGLCYDVDEPGSFVRAVETLTADRAGVERLRRHALAFAQSEYSWERYEDALLALVEPR